MEQATAAITAITYAPPPLNEGEHWAGIELGKDGAPDCHLVLLPGEAKLNWNDAKEWAASIGGELPTRREQALLYANLKEHFAAAWYWSSEQHASYSGYAWGQYFGYGYQYGDYKSAELRVRAVRKLVIE